MSLSSVGLRCGPLVALRNVDLEVHQGEVHAVVGEHGAGKSSLALVCSGFLRPSSGCITVQGQRYEYLTQPLARKLGIEIVSQHNPLFHHLTVAENILINNERRRPILCSPFDSLRQTRGFLEELGFPLDPGALVSSLGPADRVLVDVLKHLYPRPALLILEEAMEKLSNETQKRLLNVLFSLRERGMTVLIITHRIDDIYRIADRVTIIRDGEILATDSIENIDKITLIKLAYMQMIDTQTVESEEGYARLFKYYSAILNDLPVNLLVVDLHNRLKIVNRSANTFFGLLNGPYRDLTLADLISDRNAKMLQVIQEAIVQQKQMSVYRAHFHRENKQTVNNIMTYPILDGSQLIGNLIIIEDITEQESLREQVTLSENLASVGLLAAGVAHEINSPLEIIDYCLEDIRFHTTDAAVLSAVANVGEEVRSIAQIVSSLLAFSDKRKTVRELFDINALIRRLIDLIDHSARKSSIHIDFRTDREEILIESNRNEIKQVVLNIIRNSFTAMPDGGKLAITTLVSDSAGSRTLSVTFDDTGTGIEEDKLNDIFLPFFTLNKSGGRNVGLGLLVSYGIVQKYGGTISVANHPDRGCQFKILLPI